MLIRSAKYYRKNKKADGKVKTFNVYNYSSGGDLTDDMSRFIEFRVY
jgi:hypothetical protein